MLLVMLLAVLFVVAGCSSDDGAADQIQVGSDPAELLQGAWQDVTPGHGVYLTFEEGDWSLFLSSSLEGRLAWGTYTLDGDEITMVDCPSCSECGGAIAVWIMEFSESGDEADFTFVKDSCTASARGEDWRLIKHSQ